jgi:hypothetical protein
VLLAALVLPHFLRLHRPAQRYEWRLSPAPLPLALRVLPRITAANGSEAAQTWSFVLRTPVDKIEN